MSSILCFQCCNIINKQHWQWSHVISVFQSRTKTFATLWPFTPLYCLSVAMQSVMTPLVPELKLEITKLKSMWSMTSCVNLCQSSSCGSLWSWSYYSHFWHQLCRKPWATEMEKPILLTNSYWQMTKRIKIPQEQLSRPRKSYLEIKFTPSMILMD